MLTYNENLDRIATALEKIAEKYTGRITIPVDKKAYPTEDTNEVEGRVSSTDTTCIHDHGHNIACPKCRREWIVLELSGYLRSVGVEEVILLLKCMYCESTVVVSYKPTCIELLKRL